MKHYYTDKGTINYTFQNKEIKKELMEEVIRHHPFHNWRLKKVRNDIHLLLYHAAGNLIGIYKNISGSRNGNTSEWFEKTNDDPLEECLKKIFRDFINQGYVPQEFQLVVNSLHAEMVICFAI